MRRMLYITGFLVLLIISGEVAYWQMNIDPVVNVPTPVMPTPNAHDYYLRAADILHTNAPDIVPTYHSSSPGTNAKPLTPHERKLLLACQSQVTQTFRQGNSYTYLSPPVRDMDTYIPYYKQFRHLIRYFSFLAETHMQENRWPDAMDDCRHMIRLGADAQHGARLIDAVVGVACEAIGRRQAWEITEHLNAAETQKFLAAMQDINAREVTFAQVLQEEKWYRQASVAAFLRKPNWRRKLQQRVILDNIEGQDQIVIKLQFMHKRRSFNRLTSYYDQCIAVAQQPFSQCPSGGPARPADPLCRIFALDFAEAWLKLLQAHAGNRLLTVTLALHAYHVEHQRYPKALDELVSAGYLASLPADPFADAGTFRYRQSGTKYLLYSIGPDCKDDGGTPIKDEKNSKLPEHNPTLDSKGDLVVGVNKI